MVSYAKWFTPYWVCLIAGVVLGLGQALDEGAGRLSLRFVFNAIALWGVAYLAFAAAIKRPQLRLYLYGIAIVTASIHTAIVVLDLRSVMPAAYWLSADEYSFLTSLRQQQIVRDAFIRVFPSGSILMTLVFVLLFGKLVLSRLPAMQFTALTSACSLLIVAITLTLSRSLLAFALLGILVTIVMGWRYVSVTAVGKLAAAGIVSIGLIAAVDAGGRSLFERLTERGELLERDANVYSETTIRGLDNTAALTAIADNMVVGLGVPRYTAAYAKRPDAPTDIHPLLVAGLVGGVGAIAAYLIGILGFMRRAAAEIRVNKSLRRVGTPYVAALLVSAAMNLPGTGGTLDGPGLMTTATIVGILGAGLERPECL